MNGSHKTIRDTELIVQNLSNGSQAVGGARSVGYELSALLVLVEVHTAYEHGGVVLRRSRHNYVLSTCLDVSLSLLLGEEETSRFYYVLSTYCIPLQVSGVALCSYADVVAVNDELALFNVSLDSAFKLAVHRVILEHVSQVIYGAEVIDTYNLDVAASLSSTENETANTTETVNTYFDHNFLN